MGKVSGRISIIFWQFPWISKIKSLLGIEAEGLEYRSSVLSVDVNGLCRPPGINISLNSVPKFLFLHLQRTLLSRNFVEDQQDLTQPLHVFDPATKSRFILIVHHGLFC